MQTTSVSNNFDMFFECIKRICRHLLSQTVFEILVPLFVHLTQGVEYDNLSILRIYYKYNLVAHDAQATQYGSQIFKHERGEPNSYCKCHFNLPELVRGKDTPVSIDLLHGL